jgi:hypothetical protein
MELVFRELAVLVASVLFLAFGLSACSISWSSNTTPPLPGTPHRLFNYPLYGQEDYFWCGPANIQMWQQWDTGSHADQAAIFSWMESAYGLSFARGASPDSIAAGVNHFVPTTFVQVEYYSGGDEPRQGMADQRKAMVLQRPIVQMVDGGFHAVTVTGGSWHQLSTLQPSDDYVF